MHWSVRKFSPRTTQGVLALAMVAAFAPRTTAQTQYHDLDAGRPLRVEDASPTRRYSLDVDVAPFQIERLGGGVTRYRAEPRIAYGVLPFTELELRAPLIAVQPPKSSGAAAITGLAGLSLGALHAFNLETTRVPALAMGGELSLPVGTLAPRQLSFLVKGILTRTTRLGRFHLNAGIGSYALRAQSHAAGCSGLIVPTTGIPGDTTTCLGDTPIIFDMPCDGVPRAGARFTVSAMRCMAQLPDSAPAPPTSPSPTGSHWFAGVAFDRALPLRSTLLAADLFAERFVGLYPRTDWTAELGVRQQITPLLVVDLGVGRRFAGSTQSTTITAGVTIELSTPPWTGP